MARARTLRSLLLAAPLAWGVVFCAQAAPPPKGETPAAPAAAAATATPAEAVATDPLALGAFLAAQFALDAGDDDVAAEAFLKALEADPKNPEMLRRGLIIAAGDGRREDALRLALRLVAVAPHDLAAALVLAVDDMLHDKPVEAGKRLEVVQGVSADGLALPLTRAWVAAGRKDLAAARAALKPLIASQNLAPLGLAHEGMIADLLGDPKVAAAAFDAITAAIPPGEGAAWREAELMGAFYERAGQKDKAIALYQSVRLRDPEAPQIAATVARAQSGKPPTRPVNSIKEGLAEALFDIAAVAQRREQGAPVALMNLQLALALRPDNPLGLTLLGEMYERRERSDRAIALYRRIPATHPLSWRARMRIAYNLDALERTDEGVALLETMATERPEREDALTELGDLLRHRQRWAAAATAYERALARAPKIEKRHWSTLFSRAIAYERSQRTQQAVADLEQALSLEPDQPYMLNYLGYTWVEAGVNLDRAETMILRAVELRPRDGQIADSLGWFYFRRGSYDQAVVWLEKAVELTPVEATLNDHLGDAYWKAGREREALVQWRRALTMAPEADAKPLIEAKVAAGRYIEPPAAAATPAAATPAQETVKP